MNIKILKMACCGKSRTHQPLTRASTSTWEKKLGKCLFCMRLSFLGMAMSIGVLSLMKYLNTSLYFLGFCVALIAICFVVLSALHFIFYVKNKIDKFGSSGVPEGYGPVHSG